MTAHRSNRLSLRLAAAGAFAALLVSAPAPLAQERLSEMDFDVPEDPDAILGSGFRVGEVEVSPAELKRGIVVGAAGRQILESAKLQIFIDEELERLEAEGVDISKYEITSEDVEAAIEESNELVKKEYEGNEDIQNARDLFALPEGIWHNQIKQTQQFDRVFLPDDAHDYPATTIAALNQSSPTFYDQLVQGQETREAMAKEKGEEVTVDPNGQAMFRQLMRQIVIGALNKSAEVKTFNDGLPPEVALEVNGHQIKTDDIWKAIRWRVRPDDVDEVKSWYERTLTAKQALQESGDYLTDEEYDLAYHEHTDPYKDSPFNMEAVATSFKKFPSAEHYRAHFRLLESFRRKIADEITDENLQAHINNRAGSLLGLAKVDVDVILIPAFDFRISAFKENGWDEAGKRAVECVQALAGGMAWDEAVEKYSDWYEPPIAKSSQANAAQFAKNKGRFGLKNRNELLQQLGESDWSIFINGGSITDYIFFELPVGQPSQPLRGPHGYYIARVKRRTAPTSAINLSPDGHRPLVEQDYVNSRFDDFVNAQVAE